MPYASPLRTSLALAASCLLAASAWAQRAVDVQTNLLGLVNGAPNASVEVSARPRLGLEAAAYYIAPLRRWATPNYVSTGLRVEAAVNYYPEADFRGLALGAVARYSALDFRWDDDGAVARPDRDFSKRRLVLGGTLGGKWLVGDGLTLESHCGLGWAVVDRYDRRDWEGTFSRTFGFRPLSVTLRLGVGWRFGNRAGRPATAR